MDNLDRLCFAIAAVCFGGVATAMGYSAIISLEQREQLVRDRKGKGK